MHLLVMKRTKLWPQYPHTSGVRTAHSTLCSFIEKPRLLNFELQRVKKKLISIFDYTTGIKIVAVNPKGNATRIWRRLDLQTLSFVIEAFKQEQSLKNCMILMNKTPALFTNSSLDSNYIAPAHRTTSKDTVHTMSTK